ATGNTSIILVPNIEHATIEKARENVDNKNTFKCLLVRLKNEQYEVGLKNEQYEVGFMGENRKNNRQIKFRVSDHEYEELEQTANNLDRKSTRLNSSHVSISYAVFCLKQKKL